MSMCFCWSSWRNPSLPRWRLVNRNREKLVHWSPPHQMNKLDDQHHGSAIHPSRAPSLPAMKGISQPRIGRPQWTVLNAMHLTGGNGGNPKRLEQCFPLSSSESWISSWMVPLNNYHLDSMAILLGSFWFWKKRLPCFLRLKKRWHFFSNVRSPNHSPGKSSVVTGTPFNPKNTSWHLEKCLHNQSPWHPQHSEGFVTYPFTIFSTTHILLAKSCQHSRRFDLGIG